MNEKFVGDMQVTPWMDELFETTRYVGKVQDWESLPELGESPDEDEV